MTTAKVTRGYTLSSSVLTRSPNAPSFASTSQLRRLHPLRRLRPQHLKRRSRTTRMIIQGRTMPLEETPAVRTSLRMTRLPKCRPKYQIRLRRPTQNRLRLAAHLRALAASHRLPASRRHRSWSRKFPTHHLPIQFRPVLPTIRIRIYQDLPGAGNP